MLFRQHGAQLVHQYHMDTDNLPHQSLHGSFMAKLARFTHQASAEACSVAKRGRDSSSESTPTPLGPAYRTLDSAPPARRSACATATGASSDTPALTQGLPLFTSRTPVFRWRLLMTRCLRACRCRPSRFPCHYLRLSYRTLI